MCEHFQVVHGDINKFPLARLQHRFKRLGSGKAVIIGDPQRDKSPEMFRAFGRMVERLDGHFKIAGGGGATFRIRADRGGVLECRS